MTTMILTDTLIDRLTGRDADECEVMAALAACGPSTLQWAVEEISPLVPA